MSVTVDMHAAYFQYRCQVTYYDLQHSKRNSKQTALMRLQRLQDRLCKCLSLLCMYSAPASFNSPSARPPSLKPRRPDAAGTPRNAA